MFVGTIVEDMLCSALLYTFLFLRCDGRADDRSCCWVAGYAWIFSAGPEAWDAQTSD